MRLVTFLYKEKKKLSAWNSFGIALGNIRREIVNKTECSHYATTNQNATFNERNFLCDPREHFWLTKCKKKEEKGENLTDSATNVSRRCASAAVYHEVGDLYSCGCHKFFTPAAIFHAMQGNKLGTYGAPPLCKNASRMCVAVVWCSPSWATSIFIFKFAARRC